MLLAKLNSLTFLSTFREMQSLGVGLLPFYLLSLQLTFCTIFTQWINQWDLLSVIRNDNSEQSDRFVAFLKGMPHYCEKLPP